MSLLDSSPSYPAIKFVQPGDSVTGIVREFTDVPVKDFATGQVRTWNDGNPMLQTRVTLDVAGNLQSLYVKPGRMMKAVREAVKASGSQTFDEDATLTVTFTGFEQGKGANPAKAFTAKYEPFEPPAAA